jgi:cell wall-associated NlpC family hydrolase
MFSGVRLEIPMTSRSRSSLSLTHFLVVLALVLGLSGGVSTTTAAPAQALVSAAKSGKAYNYAASKRGTLYLWGGVGPRRFDCSGLTKWSYARVGKRLPRTVKQQYAATVRVRYVRKGDLVFFMQGGRPYHVGLYAGARRVLHSPKTGSRVKIVRIWTKAVIYKRVR